MIRAALYKFAMVVVLLACAPVASAMDDAGIADAVAKLSDADAAVREHAADALWSAGKAAEPALRQALTSEDPEVVRRARGILVRFELGIFPDTPQQILDCVSRYRGGDSVAHWTAVNDLADQGPRGLRVLLGLRRLETDESARAAMLRAIGAKPHEHQGAAMLLAEGDVPNARTILEHASHDSELALRDWAALLLLDGGLDTQIAAVSAEAKSRSAGVRLMYLARAKGDFALAARAADQADNTELLDSILIESGDWKRLASRYKEHLANSSEMLGFTTTFCRLAGDANGVETAAAALRSYADEHDDDYLKCAECLMLNDRVDEGVAVLQSHKNYMLAIDFLQSRLHFREALALLDQAKTDLKPDEFLQLKAREISVYRLIGDRVSAERMLHDVAAENEKQQNLTTWLALADAARELGKPDQSDVFLASAINLPAAGDGSGVVERAGLPSQFPAAFWWRILRTQQSTEPYLQTLKQLRELATGRLPAGDVDGLADAARKTAAGWPPTPRDRWLTTIGQTLQFLGHLERAEQCFDSLAVLSPSYASLESLGDCQAARGDFAKAASTYQHAWDMDRTSALPLALRGWAQLQSGDINEARATIELAHALPLADESQRTALEETFREHGLLEDARRERDLICKTGSFFSWEVCNANHLSGDDSLRQGDFQRAADFFERAFLRNLRKDTFFLRPDSNLAVRILIHKANALADIKQTPIDALREAQTAMKVSPGAADAMIELVQAFDRAGHKDEADALFASSLTGYTQFCQDFPMSGPAQNLLAWAEGRCHRNLDDALKHALRAVELDPSSTDDIDTLAEVYFQRGQVIEAIAQTNKCIALAPDVPHYKEQLMRFAAAQSGMMK